MADDDLVADNGDDASAGRVRAGLLYPAAVAAILSSGVELLSRSDGYVAAGVVCASCHA